MVKLVKKELVSEAKQVGKLYHVTTLDSLIQYIIPTDTLSGSGRYKNWMLGGRTDVVSFTRDKRFVVKTNKNEIARVIYSFEVDGDKLSEKYRILPYNDFAFNSDSGTLDLDTYNEEELEKEEVVVGKIHPFSKYVTGVRFSVSIQGLGDIIDLVEDYNIKYSLPYLDKFEVKCDPRLVTSKNKRGWIFLSFPSYKDFVDSFVEIQAILSSPNILKIDISDIKNAFRIFTKGQLNFLLGSVVYGRRLSGINKERGVYTLVCAGADYHSIGLKEISILGENYIMVLWPFLSYKEKEDYSMEGVDLDMIKDFIPKENLKEPFINNFYDIISEDPEYQVSLLKRIKLSPVEKNKIKKTAQEISDVELNDKDINDYNKLIEIISDNGKGVPTPLFNSLVEKHVKDMSLAEFNEWLDKPNTYSKYFPYDILGMENSESRELCYQLSSLGIIPARELRDFLIKMKDDYIKTKMKKL